MAERQTKIAIDCRMIGMSGIGSYLKGILPHLLQMGGGTDEFLLIGNREELADYRITGIRILDNRTVPFSIKESFGFDSSEINRCDCYYSPNYNVPFGIKVPIISTVHDVLFLDRRSIQSRLGYFIRKAFLKQVIYRSHGIFTVSQFSASRIRHYFGQKKEIIVTYNGVRELFKTMPEYVRPTRPYYIYVGNIKPHKGLKTLLEAHDLLRNNDDRRQLVIVGENRNFKTGDAHVQLQIDAGVQRGDIVFTGRINDDTLVKLMAHADFLVQPSDYEGFGIPPLEGMWLHTPVILSDIAVFKELYADYPVFFFRNNDAEDLCRIMETVDPVQRVFLTAEQKSRYDYAKSAKIIYEYIDKVCRK